MTPRTRKKVIGLHVEHRWRHYSNNPEDFFRECVWVPAGERIGQGRGRVNLELFDYQQECLDVFRNERYTIVLKARQLGLTTIAMAHAMWLLLFRPGSNIVLVSKNQTTADKALELIDFMYQFLPDSIKARGPVLENNAAKHHSYRFKDGMVSQITSYAATKTVAAGQTASLVIWDEAALAEYQEDVLRTLLPTTDAGGSMIVFSTARGGHNMFAQIYRDAKVRENQFKALFYPWSKSKLITQGDYDAKWRAMKDEPWRFYAEYPSSDEEAFRQSGRNRFASLPPEDQVDTDWIRGSLISGLGRPEFVPSENGPLRMLPEAFDGPPAGARPVVSLDPASGTGGDYTAISGGWLDEDGTPVRVAFWHSNLTEPVEAALEAAHLGEYLRDSFGMPALMVVEKQGGYGDSIIHELRENLLYQNLYRFTYTGHRRRRSEQAYGFPMTYSRRPLVIDSLARWVNYPDQVMGGIDPILRQELGAFVIREDGRVMADAGMHDDMVMSAAILVYVLLERGSWATEEPISEELEDQVFSVSHIFDEAETVRRENRLDERRRGRRRGRGYLGHQAV
jgi:hypothetical protein